MTLFLVGITAVALLGLVGTDWDNVRLLELPQVYDRLPRLISGVPNSGLPRTSDLFSPREVGATMAMLLPVAVIFLFWGRSWQIRSPAASAVLVGTAVLSLSQAVMGYWGLGLALLLILIWWRRWLWVAIPIGLLTVGGLVFIVGPTQLALTLLDINHLLGIGFVLRLDMWSRALAMIGDMPFTGIGLNTYP